MARAFWRAPFCNIRSHIHKGGEYQVLDTVRHSETLEPLTLYRALYGAGGLWVRPAAMFNESVQIDGQPRPRFERVSD